MKKDSIFIWAILNIFVNFDGLQKKPNSQAIINGFNSMQNLSDWPAPRNKLAAQIKKCGLFI